MINRRKLLAGVAGGALFGLTGVMLTRGGGSIRFIGHDETIIALLDNGSNRTIIVLGEPHEWLLENIPGLTTVGNSRIDLIVGTHRVLTSLAAREYLEIDSTPTLVIQGRSDLPPIRGDVSQVIDPTHLALSESWDMRIDLKSFEADHPDFAIELQHGDLRLALVSGASALSLLSIAHPQLLVMPGSTTDLVGNEPAGTILVATERNDELNTSQLVVFPSDPEIVRIQDDTLSLREDQLSS